MAAEFGDADKALRRWGRGGATTVTWVGDDNLILTRELLKTLMCATGSGYMVTAMWWHAGVRWL
jgi:hypothetical protein